MIPEGKGKRMLMAVWMAAGILLVAYNGSVLRTLFAPSPPGLSAEMRRALQDYERLSQKKRTRARSSGDEINSDRLFAGEAPSLPPAHKPEGDQGMSGGRKCRAETGSRSLPILSGITRSMDIHGKIRLIATLAGMTLRENGKVGGFTLLKITGKGVILEKGTGRWFIPAPEARYSMDVSAGQP